MLARLIARRPALTLSRIELDRPGPSYAVETLESFAAAEPDRERWLILGGDQLLELPRWRDPERIVRLARLAVAARGDQDRGLLREAADRIAPGRVSWIEMPAIGISASLVRERLDAGQPVGHLLPDGVSELLPAD